MKTLVRTLQTALVMIFLFVGTAGTLNAQKAFVFNDIPALLADLDDAVQTEIILTAEVTRTTYDVYYESELEFEDWMLGDKEWVKALDDQTNRELIFEVEEETDQLEDWMLEPFISGSFVQVEEEELVLENWMIDNSDWVK